MTEVKKELEKVKDIVLKILEEDDRARNDDKYLIWRVMRKFTNFYVPFEDFDKIPSYESVRRVRAYIQNVEHKFMPTNPEVMKKRRHNEEEWKKYFSPKNREG